MITFRCKRCGQEVSAPDEYSGKQVKCPKCGSVNVVPGTLTKIKFRCKNCGQKISVPQNYAGKRGTCPRCKNTVIIPKAESPQPRASQSNSSDLETIPKGSDLDLSIFDIPQESKAATQPISQYDVSDRAFESVQKLEERPEVDETESVGKRKLPWPVDIFLYPISVPGLTNLAIFIGVPLLIGALRKLLGSAALVLVAPTVIINILLGLYMCWYFAECVRDSAIGETRAPEAFATADLDVMFSQSLNLLGCYLFFWGPAGFYRFYLLFIGETTDKIFRILLGYGIFFFPMGLLAVVIFDSSSGLNPILLIRSIFRTFFPYCGLVLILGVVVLIAKGLPDTSPIFAAVLHCINVYLVLVAAHLLGRFYWRYEEKLNWEI